MIIKKKNENKLGQMVSDLINWDKIEIVRAWEKQQPQHTTLRNYKLKNTVLITDILFDKFPFLILPALHIATWLFFYSPF